MTNTAGKECSRKAQIGTGRFPLILPYDTGVMIPAAGKVHPMP